MPGEKQERVPLADQVVDKIDVGTPEEVEETPEGEDVVELTPLQQKAAAKGWKPLEEWEADGKDPDEWTSAGAFLKMGDLFDSMFKEKNERKKMEKRTEQLAKTISELREMQGKIAEREYKKAVADLRKQKKIALEEGDHDTVMEIDDELAELRVADPAKQKQPEQEQEQSSDSDEPQDLAPEEAAYIERNKDWFGKDRRKTAVANAAYDEYFEEHGKEGSFEDAFAYVDQVLEETFGQKQTPKRARAADVAEPRGQGVRATPAKSNFARKMTAEQRQIAQNMVRDGAYTSIEAYAKDLAEIGELG